MAQPNETARFTIGSEVHCEDGACGELRRVVVEPIDRVLTHLVVEPRHRHRQRSGRLVPIDLVDVDAAAPELRLCCSLAEYENLEAAEETRFLSGADNQWGYGEEQMLSWPHYGLGMGGGLGASGRIDGLGPGAAMGPGFGLTGTSRDVGAHVVVRDRVPLGEIEVRRGEHVHTVDDGTIGRVQGLVVDRADHHVTHVLLDEGHLWGHKQVAIPIGEVADVDDGVRLTLTKNQVRDLPAIELEQPV